jgi:hypothetical protein
VYIVDVTYCLKVPRSIIGETRQITLRQANVSLSTPRNGKICGWQSCLHSSASLQIIYGHESAGGRGVPTVPYRIHDLLLLAKQARALDGHLLVAVPTPEHIRKAAAGPRISVVVENDAPNEKIGRQHACRC